MSPERAPSRLLGADGSFFARLMRPGCCRVIDFSDAAPTFLLRLQILQLQSEFYPLGTGRAEIRPSIWPNSRRCRCPSASSNQALGQQDGQEASGNADTVGFPNRVNLWCDLEGVNGSAQAKDVIHYCEAWYEAVSAEGYIPGLYVGSEALLNGRQLYDLPFQHYWRSQSQVPDIPHRGYQVVQLSPPIQLNGVRIDLDVAVNDGQGRAAQWLWVKTAILGG